MMSGKSRATANALIWKAKSKRHIRQLRLTKTPPSDTPKTLVEPVDLEWNHCCLFERKDSFSTRPNSQQQILLSFNLGRGMVSGKCPGTLEHWNRSCCLAGTLLELWNSGTLETCNLGSNPANWNLARALCSCNLVTRQHWNPGTLDVCKSGTLVLGTLNLGNLHAGNPQAWELGTLETLNFGTPVVWIPLSKLWSHGTVNPKILVSCILGPLLRWLQTYGGF